jgi:hypothetical protein
MISREELTIIMNDCLISDDPFEALINRVDFQLEALDEVAHAVNAALMYAPCLDIRYSQMLPLMNNLKQAEESLKKIYNFKDWQTCGCCDRMRHRSQFRHFPTENYCIPCEGDMEHDIEDGVDEAAS